MDYQGISIAYGGEVEADGNVYLNTLLSWEENLIKETLREQFGNCVICGPTVDQGAYAEWTMAPIAPDQLFVNFYVDWDICCVLIKDGQFIKGMGMLVI